MPIYETLLNSEGFRQQMHALTMESVCATFTNIIPSENFQKPSHDWQHLLLSASYLAQCPSERAQATALRIAHHSLISSKNDSNRNVAATIVFDILTNRPSIDLAIRKDLIQSDFKKQIPIPLRFDMLRREIGHLIFHGEKSVYLNRFQKEVYQALEDFDCLSISAPTSAGKSFILEQYVREFASGNPKNIIIIVPTRALIQQVESNLQEMFSGEDQKPLISSVPQISQDWSTRTNILVYTQERLQWLLNDAPSDFKIDLLIIDEAQKIGDGARGILLQQAIETVFDQSPKCKIVFSSPMSRNPELLFEHVNHRGTRIISELVTVNQNLIWVSQTRGKPQNWTVELCFHNGRSLLGTINLPERPTDIGKRLAFVARAMSDSSGGSLVYANGQAEAENIARLLSETITDKYDDPDITSLIDLISKTIHPKYALLDTLPHGVAFHYGNIPLLIRTEIERLFKEGKIKFLVCTSTLIEGVNLPARSIFVRRPTKGHNKPMDEIDFWNMAGRAGRLGKEFQGNIICVDPNLWESPPPQQRKRYPITRSLDSVMLKIDSLLKYIDVGEIATDGLKKPELEHAFAYFFIQDGRHGSLTKAPFAKNYNPESLQSLQKSLIQSRSKISLPLAVIVRNPGVSPLAQQSLLQYFNGFDKPIDELIPLLPESNEPFDSYVRLVQRVSKHLSGDHLALSPYYAVLVINWMRGYPLSRIINDNIKYWEKRPEKGKNISTIIRESMRDIEEFARFKFAKYSSCYVDVLRFFLRQNGHQKYLDQIPNLHIWLEFGASQQTQISFMGLGLSRQTAIEISKLIPRHDLTREEAILWLKEKDPEKLDFSPIILAELKKILGIL